MKDKLKIQRKSITIKIATVLLIVWLIVSLIFSVITLTVEKQTQLTYEHNNYDYFIDCITGMHAPYNETCKYVEVVKAHWRDMVLGDLVPKITCGADGTYDENLQLVVFEYLSDEDGNMLMDSDKEIYVSFVADDFIEATPNSGILNYDEFVSSMTQEQLQTIIEYLNTKKDKDGYYYILCCGEIYYNPENGHIYPKTVEIAKAHEEDCLSVKDEVIETFSLNPKNTEELKLYPSSSYAIIEGQFVCNNFSSGGLIVDPYEPIDYTKYDSDVGIVEKTGLFTYLYTNGGTYSIETLGFEGSEYAIKHYQAEEEFYNELANEVLYNYEEEERIAEFLESNKYLEKQIGVKYVKRINLLECTKDTLILGISAIFLFFLIIGIILTVMMYKVIKTQLIEEEKRRETTNALAHDIKTPLFIISGYAQNLKDNVNPDKNNHYIDRIIERVGEVNELVHKMLDFSKLSTVDHKLNLEIVEISEIIKNALKDYETLPQGKKLNLNIDSKCEQNVDKALMSRAVSYLLDNAIRHSDENSSIDIRLDKKSLSISNKCSNITQEDIKHITEPYYRVEKNRESKGNGLGLSIVKSIVDAHSFTLEIKLINNTITFTIVFHK